MIIGVATLSIESPFPVALHVQSEENSSSGLTMSCGCVFVCQQDPYIIGALGTSYIQAIQAYRGPGQAVRMSDLWMIRAGM